MSGEENTLSAITCQEFELSIDEYIDDVLEEVENKQFEAHFIECDECSIKLQLKPDKQSYETNLAKETKPSSIYTTLLTKN